MYCESCGSKLGGDVRYCESCGESVIPLQEQKSNLLDTIFQRKGISISRLKMILSVTGIGLLILFFLYLFGFMDNSYVKLVKNGELLSYPNIEVGQAFESYFDNTKWEYFESTEGEDIVEFNGECLLLDERVNVTIQFNVNLDGEEFNIQYLGIDDVASFWMLPSLLEAVMEDYN
ncbi:MAG: hypothetical protein K2G70_02790 [Turicibacter sp.]|nr:hypothetical protein [Turicibacter sp.]